MYIRNIRLFLLAKLKLFWQTVSARKWPPSWTNKNILFTKSGITSECHNIFGWNKKHYFNEWLAQTMSLSSLIFWQWLWPKFYLKCSKLVQKSGPKCSFSPFLRIIFGVFVKTSLKTVQTFIMEHTLKFPAKNNFFFARWGSQGVHANCHQNSIEIFFFVIALGWVLGPTMAQNTLFPCFSELFLVFLLKHSSNQYRVLHWVMV